MSSNGGCLVFKLFPVKFQFILYSFTLKIKEFVGILKGVMKEYSISFTFFFLLIDKSSSSYHYDYRLILHYKNVYE